VPELSVGLPSGFVSIDETNTEAWGNLRNCSANSETQPLGRTILDLCLALLPVLLNE